MHEEEHILNTEIVHLKAMLTLLKVKWLIFDLLVTNLAYSETLIKGDMWLVTKMNLSLKKIYNLTALQCEVLSIQH